MYDLYVEGSIDEYVRSVVTYKDRVQRAALTGDTPTVEAPVSLSEWLSSRVKVAVS
jgi:hypothetical protein